MCRAAVWRCPQEEWYQSPSSAGWSASRTAPRFGPKVDAFAGMDRRVPGRPSCARPRWALLLFLPPLLLRAAPLLPAPSAPGAVVVAPEPPGRHQDRGAVHRQRLLRQGQRVPPGPREAPRRLEYLEVPWRWATAAVRCSGARAHVRAARTVWFMCTKTSHFDRATCYCLVG